MRRREGTKKAADHFINEIPVCFLVRKITSNLKRSKREVVFIPNLKELNLSTSAGPSDMCNPCRATVGHKEKSMEQHLGTKPPSEQFIFL